MERGPNIICLNRNGHWFYFRWADENKAKMLFQAYLQAVDPVSVFDAVGLRRLTDEIKAIPEEGIRENYY